MYTINIRYKHTNNYIYLEPLLFEGVAGLLSTDTDLGESLLGGDALCSDAASGDFGVLGLPLVGEAGAWSPGDDDRLLEEGRLLLEADL